VGYGSNLRTERFECYIKGGQPKLAHKTDPGCNDPSPPLRVEKVSIPYQLYFAEASNNWTDGDTPGAVAFLGHEVTTTNPTIGRMYLITEDQFKDVFKQENGIPVATESNLFDLREVNAKTRVTFLHGKGNWYGTIVYLGDKDGYPKYTFTASREHGHYNAPSRPYLRTIIAGLREMGDVTAQEGAEYLHKAPGVARPKTPGGERGYTIEDLKALFSEK
jgi:hypothetical protein